MTPQRTHAETTRGSRGWWLAAAAVALAVATTIVWRAAREPAPATIPAVTAAPIASVAAPGARAATGRVAPLPSPAQVPDPEHGIAGLSTDDPLTAYRKANVYPPTSRPLASDQLDLLRPNQRHEVMQPADHGKGVSFLFTADRYFVIGDDTLTSRLEVRRDGAPLAVTIVQAYAAVIEPGHDARPIPLVFTANGAALTQTFAPAQLGLARQAAIGMYVEFDDGIGRQRAHFDFQYTPAAGIPARFTGVFHDALEAGSLVIRAGIDVVVAGRYVIDANLFDAAEQPVAWSRFKGELAAGAHTADLVFFGKVIVDANAHGPFHLGQLRGARFDPSRDPDLEQMPPFTGAYATQAYQTEQFSDAEYDSAEKQRMIELLGADHGHRGGAGRDPGGR